jgi:dienelactone hydrolase
VKLTVIGLAFAAAILVEVAQAQTAPVTAPTSAPARIPVADFARLPFMSAPKLSPNGQFVAATIAVGGVESFAILGLASTQTKPVVVGIPNDISLDYYAWVNDDWILATITATKKLLDDPVSFRVSRQISISRDGKTINYINKNSGGQFDSVIYIPSDGSTRILLSASDTIYLDTPGQWPHVSEVDVATGKVGSKLVVGREPVQNWYADSSGNVRLGYGYDYERNRAVLLYKKPAEAGFKTLDTANLSKDEAVLSPVLFLPDPNKIVIQDRINGKNGLYEYDIDKRTVGATIFESEKFEIAGAVESANRQSIAGVAYADDRPRTEWLDPVLKNMQAEIEKAVPGKFVTIASRDAKQRKFIIHIGSSQDPGRYYLFSLDDGALYPYAWRWENLRGKSFAQMKAVSYKARDGLEIPAYLTLPIGRTDKNLPLIIFPHGGPSARDYLGYDEDVQFLANRGYAVLQPNYRGSSGYGFDFAKRGEGQWGLAMQDDVTDGVKWLVAQGVVDAKRVCIMGASYGGYAAMTGMVRDPDLYRCAVSFAGISDLPALLRYDSNFLYYKGQKKALKGEGADLNVVSAINNIDKIKTPLLLIHGKKDLRVPYDQSAKLAKALLKAGKTVEFVTQPEGDHHLSREEDRVSYFTAIDAFLAKYNPAD